MPASQPASRPASRQPTARLRIQRGVPCMNYCVYGIRDSCRTLDKWACGKHTCKRKKRERERERARARQEQETFETLLVISPLMGMRLSVCASACAFLSSCLFQSVWPQNAQHIPIKDQSAYSVDGENPASLRYASGKPPEQFPP